MIKKLVKNKFVIAAFISLILFGCFIKFQQYRKLNSNNNQEEEKKKLLKTK